LSGTDIGLKLLHEAFDFKSLHLGYFTDAMPRTVAGVREAQAEYVRQLVDLVPDGTKTVLDVGAGLGDTSKLLHDSGHEVEGLSPDPYLGEEFSKTCGGKVPFHLSRFEDYSPGRTYDCLLFGESPQYIEKDRFFPKCIELTKPGSSLVLADFFQIAPCEDYKDCFVESDFLRRAEAAGFRMANHRDITENVIPTFEVARIFMGYGQRLLHYVTDTARRKAPVKWWLARLFYGRKLDRARELLEEKLPRRLDADRFRRQMRYAMYSFTRGV
jgi:MPBQ/MSBQ methyltransferase